MINFKVNNIEVLVKSFDKNFTDTQCEEIRQSFKQKPKKEDVLNDLRDLHQRSIRVSRITDYYVRDLMYDVKSTKYPISINEAIESNDFLRYIKGKVDNNHFKVNDKKGTLYSRMNVLLRLEGTYVRAAGNYPVSSVRRMLELYAPGKVYYDYSCGWGNRLLGALSKRFEYLGTDPNHKLVERLQEMGKDYSEVNEGKFDIRAQGSEEYVPEWENKVDIAFSSPPYFDLEHYIHGDQSIDNRDYNQWLEEYWRGTVKNIKRYLKDNGIFLLNIKNIKNYPLLDDMQRISEEEGFVFNWYDELKNVSRPMIIKGSSSEKIIVFSKKPLEPTPEIREHLIENEKAKKMLEEEIKRLGLMSAEQKEEERKRAEEEMLSQLVDEDSFKETSKKLQSIFRRYKRTKKRERPIPPSKR